jgi:hypothetical protein
MDLHGCPECGAVEVAWQASLADENGIMGRRYHGTCESCGREREFVFALPDRPTPPRPGEQVTFGAAGDRSALFDAGQWLAIAEMLTLAAGLDVPEDERAESLGIAIGCVDEVLKFLPEGATEPPPTAFWSVEGRVEYDRGPGRFDRPALEQRRADLTARLG